MPIYRCLNNTCRKDFEARKADRDRGWALYCSKGCKASHQTFLRSNGLTLKSYLATASKIYEVPAEIKPRPKKTKPPKPESTPKPENYGEWA